ncbi:MAG: SGNH/GDSL hydrolase family protein [Fimbriimonas sp.]
MSAWLALLVAPFALKTGDRVVFYGDSITEAGAFARVVYPAWVETYALTRFPDRDIRFWNRGWAGDTSWGGPGGSSEERVSRDVRPLKPTVVSVMLGMNDTGYVPYDPKIDAVFQEWYGKLLGWIHDAAPTARLSLIQTSPYDDVTRDPAKEEAFTASMIRLGYNSVLLRFGNRVREAAEKRQAQFVDFNAPLVDLLKASDPVLARRLIPDAIHPADALQIAMAASLLEAWNAPALVSDVELDVLSGQVRRAENARVSNLKGLEWTTHESALPLPLDPSEPTTAYVLRHARIGDRLNRQRLTIHGLKPGRYDLQIDGLTVGTFGADALGQGINLADYPTPMRRQAARVLELVLQRNRADKLRWREIDLGFPGVAGRAEARRGLDRLEEKLRDATRRAAIPKPHRYRLRSLDAAPR